MQQDIKKAIEVLRSGGVILYPTDTIWGIGCDATNSIAVKKVFEIKQRMNSKSLILLMDCIEMIRYYCTVPDIAEQLIEVADKPLTIIYSDAVKLAPEVLAEDGSVGIRIPNDKFCLELITRFGKPIVSTSANISGEPFPQDFSHINPVLLDAVDYVVNWRQHEKSSGAVPSSIIKLGPSGEIKIIR